MTKKGSGTLVMAMTCLFLTLSIPVPAYAQETQPLDLCTLAESGRYRLSGGAELGGEGYLLSCNGAQWVKIFSFQPDGVFRPAYTNIGECADAVPLVYDGTTGGIRCGAEPPLPPPTLCAPEDLVWTIETPATGNQYRGITYGGGLFAAASGGGGDAEKIMTSNDGVNWHNVGVHINVMAITYGNGRFVALGVGWDNDHRVAISDDGVVWQTYANVLPVGGAWNSVTYGANGFVAVDGETTSRVLVSPDGLTWTAVNVEADVPGGRWTKIAYGNGRYVATRGWFWNNTGSGVMTSADGVNWTGHSETDGCNSVSLAYGAAGGFVGAGCWPNWLLRSTDGQSWTLGGYSGVSPEFRNVTYGHGIGYIGVSGTHIYYSTDGVQWGRRAAPAGWGDPYDANVLAYGHGVFVSSREGAVLRGACPAP